VTSSSIILIPGTEGSAEESFIGLMPLLARDHDVVPFNFRSGLGQDPHEVFNGYVDQLRDTIDSLPAGQRVHLLGYSLGAHIALQATAGNRRVESLCLVGGWLKTDDLQRERHDLWLQLYNVEPELAGKLSHLLQYSPTYRSLLSQQQTATRLVPRTPDEETRQRVLVNRILNHTEVASQINVPTLIISGAEDLKVPFNHAHQLFGALSTATLLPINSGHAILHERLGQVYGAYADFLEGDLTPGKNVTTLVP
jgi:pimeloyl-ACP methyl ester carboxylesterase